MPLRLLIFRRYPSWIMAILIWPILFPFVYIFTARALSGPHGSTLPTFARAAGTSDYVSFIVIGTVLWMWLNMTLWDMGYFLRNEQMHGTLESNWLCPVWRISIMLGASLTKLATSVLFLGVTVLEFAKEILALSGSSSAIDYRPLPQDDPRVRKPDISRARQVLGWEPRVNRSEGLRRTLEYFKAKVQADRASGGA